MADKNEKTFYKQRWFWRIIVIIAIIVMILLLLPLLSGVYLFVVPHKVDPAKLNVSRIELVKLFISLIAPVLTFLVFRNTLSMQKKAADDREEEQNASKKRRQLDDANREFYSLLELFKKEQEKSETKRSIEKIMETIDGTFASINEKNWEDTSSINPIIWRYKDDYKTTSSYFKIVHRIVKNLNIRLDEEQIDKGDYQNYIGILRTQLSSIELVVILVNSLFIQRGLGLGIELIGTNLFGDKKDFKVNQHFDISKEIISLEKLSIFVNDEDGENIKKRMQYEKKLEKINDIEEYKKINNFNSFIKQK